MTGPLADLETVAAELAALKQAERQTLDKRRALIDTAREHGHRKADIARALGISAPRLDELLRG